jgi:flavin reductase (DIM6/NTAB) family NADH-FMN oxidoreductase RutF
MVLSELRKTFIKEKMNFNPHDKQMTSFDPQTMSQKELYFFMISTIVPRPIAWISTMNHRGCGNLAPFSFFNAVASSPPTIMVSIAHKANAEKKDTLVNIQETKEFVVNSSNCWLTSSLTESAKPHPYGVDELEKANLTPLDSVCIKPKRIKESAFQLECIVSHILPIGDPSTLGSTHCVFGTIVYMHIYPEFLEQSRVQTEKLNLLSRAGGSGYYTLGSWVPD